MTNLAIIIATKDRPEDLRRAIASLAGRSEKPYAVIIVDGGDSPLNAVIAEFSTQLSLKYLRHVPPSASAQRNAGIRSLPPEASLVAFLDDDATLEESAVAHMMSFWRTAPLDIGGCACNLVNPPEMRATMFKRSWMAEMLGLYSARLGAVMPSGWQTMIGTVHETSFVDWLPSTAVVWRKSVLATVQFDEFFTGYSYLEDLDLSFTVRRGWRLAVLAEAFYAHNPSTARHLDSFGFGRIEILNRLHFVRKHHLSVPLCWLAIAGRLGMTLGHAARHFDAESIRRACGNISEIVSSLVLGNSPPNQGSI